MKFFLKQNFKSGFTLVETLVAISIFTLAVLAVLVILGGGLKSTNIAKQKIIASYLAQEGVELMRNMRDTYVLYDGGSTGWGEFLAHVDGCQQKGCIFHTEELVYGDPDKPITDITIEHCSGGSGGICPELYFHPVSGKYDYDAGGSGTILSGYRRHIRIEILNDHEARISSHVFWDDYNKEVVFTENIFDWHS